MKVIAEYVTLNKEKADAIFDNNEPKIWETIYDFKIVLDIMFNLYGLRQSRYSQKLFKIQTKLSLISPIDTRAIPMKFFDL